MLRRTTLTRLAVPAAAAALVAGFTVPSLYATADATAAEECVQAGNVWVHVAYDETVTGACATEFASAQDAVVSSGVSTDQGWIQTVDGRLAEGKEWWSVYTLSPDTQGSYDVEWAFAEVGVAELEPTKSSVLALQLQDDYDVDAVAPAVNPVKDVVLGSGAPAPEPTATPTQPSPQPEATPSAPITAKPGVPGSGY